MKRPFNTTAPSASSARILLADDNADIRGYVRRLLAAHWTVEAVEDGQRALEAARAHPPDLVVTDAMMPRLDGFGLLAALRDDEATKTIPVLMLSAHAGEDAVLEGLSAGAVDYLVKPFSSAELVARVRSQLELVRRRNEVYGKPSTRVEAPTLRFADSAEASQVRRARQASFANEVGAALARGGALRDVLATCTRLAVQHLDVALARIVTIDGDGSPGLQASAGIDDSDGAEGFDLGWVARGRRVYAIDDVAADPVVTDPQWARARGLVAFAGYPLVVEDRCVGVFAIFARRRVPQNTVEALESVAQTIAIGIERTRADEHRAQLLHDLQQAVQLNETFVGMLGHDLRNPLGAILTAADLLRDTDRDERFARPIGRIRSSAGRMARMIEQILDLTRARVGGGIPIEPTNVDLERLAIQLVEELEGSAPHPILLRARGTLGGTWDGDRLAQVISNLLSNGIDHGDARRPVRLELDGTEADTVRISVSSSGVIPAADLPTLFDPFRRAAAASRARKSHGLGLGLYIVQQLVHAHGGHIEASSSEPMGTEFVVELPRVASVREAAQRR